LSIAEDPESDYAFVSAQEVKKQSARTAPIAEQNVEDFESEFNALAVTKELDQKERT
jgi:hypothetical protein